MKFSQEITQEKYQALCDASIVLIDMLADSLHDLIGGRPSDDLTSWLPPQFARHYTPKLARRFWVTAVSMAATLDQWDGTSEIVTCTADALVLDHIIGLAQARIECDPAYDEDHLPSPESLDFRDFEDLLFPDLDYELLLNPQFDGVEDSELANAEGMYLRVDQWFTPYGGDQWIHPYCRADAASTITTPH